MKMTTEEKNNLISYLKKYKKLDKDICILGMLILLFIITNLIFLVSDEYKGYAGTHIPHIKQYIEYDKNNIWNTKRVDYNNNMILIDDKKLINDIVDKLENYTSTDLVTLTQNQKPWVDVYESDSHNEITNQSLYEYFSK